MALIKCPECGKEVSDKASVCPVCAYPIAESKTAGLVRIKMSSLKKAMGGRQKVTVRTTEGEILWEGSVGQIAEINIEKETQIEVQYHLSPMYYGGTCVGVVNPDKGKKYNVHTRQGLMKTIMELQIVDVIDSD